jgi:hypothetical protein
MRRLIALSALLLSLTACGAQHWSATAPTSDPTPKSTSGTFRPLSLVIGSWYGEETATVGESGTLTVNFTQQPGADPNVSANAVWIGKSGILATGTIQGQLPTVTITVTSIQGPGTACGYTASATLNTQTTTHHGQTFAPNTLFTGEYHGTGPGVCATKAGTFWLTGNSQQACTGSGQLNFPLDAYIAMFPVGFPNPFLPSSVGPFPFSIPAGTWHLVAVTGDLHSQKQDGPQLHEQGHFVFDTGVTTIDTTDIQDAQDLQGTDLGVLTFAAPASSVSFVHYVETVTEPTDSLRPVSLAYSCPAQ